MLDKPPCSIPFSSYPVLAVTSVHSPLLRVCFVHVCVCVPTRPNFMVTYSSSVLPHSMMQAILLGLGLQRKSVDDLQVILCVGGWGGVGWGGVGWGGVGWGGYTALFDSQCNASL